MALSDALVDLAEHVAGYGLTGRGPYRTACELLLRSPPAHASAPLIGTDESVTDGAIRLAGGLEGHVLPIQGSPGAGKTVTGAQMIVALVGLGKTVGVTANSHKVIDKLLDEAVAEAGRQGVPIACGHKTREPEPPRNGVVSTQKAAELVAALGHSISVGGATAWVWARPDAIGIVDVLFVDEAGQMALANLLAAARAARAIVLLGDPQQHANARAIRGARAILDRLFIQAFQVLRQEHFQRP